MRPSFISLLGENETRFFAVVTTESNYDGHPLKDAMQYEFVVPQRGPLVACVSRPSTASFQCGTTIKLLLAILADTNKQLPEAPLEVFVFVSQSGVW